MTEINSADAVPIECKKAMLISAQVTKTIRRVKSMTEIEDVDTTSPIEQTESKLLASNAADANHQTTSICSPNAVATKYFAFAKDDLSESKINNTDLATISSLSTHALPASPENLPRTNEVQTKEPNSTSCHTDMPSRGYFQTERDTCPIGEAGGINLILRAARQFPHDLNAQMCGLLTINNLTKNSNETTEFSNKDCIEMVLRGMQEFPEDVQITTIGLTALESLASMDCDNRSMIGNMGGVNVVLSSMHHFLSGKCRDLG